MTKGTQAMRSGYQTVIDPETELLKDAKDKALTDIESEEERATAAYASLRGHPGWELIKKDFEATIANYRSGKAVASAIQAGKTNAEIGDLVRTSNAIADELEQKVLTVEGAALALEQDGSKRKRVS